MHCKMAFYSVLKHPHSTAEILTGIPFAHLKPGFEVRGWFPAFSRCFCTELDRKCTNSSPFEREDAWNRKDSREA